MHIVMISDYETYGGAAIAASRLATGLCSLGHKVSRIVAGSDRHDHPWDTIEIGISIGGKISRRLLPRNVWNSYTRGSRERALAQILDRLNPDIVNIHNIHGAVIKGWALGFVKICQSFAPVVWTLHDTWSFTGRCAYPYDCQKFVTGCDEGCSTVGEYPSLEPKRIAADWNLRRRLLNGLPNLTAVSPSRWLANEARKGLWSNRNVITIPNGLPLGVYSIRSREDVRSALGVGPTETIALVVAQSLDDRRKGVGLLVEGLKGLAHKRFTLMTVGSGSLGQVTEQVQVKNLGYITEEARMVMIYNAADLLIHPAPADNLPNVVMESIACGTPVVAYPVGGVPEMVRPGQSGWLADFLSPVALGAKLDTALSDIEHGIDLRVSCRSIAEAEYNLETQTQRYVSLFESLCQDQVGNAYANTVLNYN